jgi:hypothetical protein
MNMFRAFMELDEAYSDRQYFIDELKKAGKNYNFNKYTDAQLYRMCQRLQKPAEMAKEPEHELDLDFESERDLEYCDCGERLTDFGQCPVCDLGEEDLTEDVKYCWFGYYLDKDGNKKTIYATKDSTSYDADEGAEMLEELIPEPYTKFVFRGSIDSPQAEKAGWVLVEWVSASGNKVNLNNINTTTQSQPVTAPTPQIPKPHLPSGRYAVRIVSHNGRLRALGTDGVHPAAWVAFPNNLRQFEGQLYEVDQLIWNGKNYRVAGNIVEI